MYYVRIIIQWTVSDLGLIVLESVCLVHHQDLPVDGAQDCRVNTNVLIGSQQDMELAWSIFLHSHTQGWREGGGE